MGGGGDGGYGERQAKQDAEKQAARNAINVIFGVAPTKPALDTEGFMRPGQQTYAGEGGGAASFIGDPTLDQAAYDAALQGSLTDQQAQAQANKSALDSLYGKVRTDAYNYGKRRFDETRDKSARDLKFELFARGLAGGSVDVDQNALLGRTYTQGLTDLGAKADATSTALRTGDEATRVNLLQGIESGMDQGSAVSSALTQMRNNADRAASEAQGLSIGDLFANAGLLYEQGRRARGELPYMGMPAGYRYNTRPSGATLGSGGTATITRSG